MKTNLFSASWRPAVHQTGNAIALAAGDALILMMSLWIGRLAVHLMYNDVLSIRYSILIVPVWWAGALLVGLLPGWGLGDVEELRRMEVLTLVVFAAGGVIYFFIPHYFSPSRIAYVISLLFALLFLPFGRILVKSIMAKAGVWGCPAVVYATPDLVRDVVPVFKEHPVAGYRPVGVFLDAEERPESIEGLPVLGGYHEATPTVPAALVCIGPSADKLGSHFDRTLGDYRHVVLLPMIGTDVFQLVTPRSMAGLVGLEVTSNLLNPVSHAGKRVLDLLVVVLAAPLWVPVFAGISAVLFLTGGRPVFYRQERLGRRGEVFCPLKFQTMVADADEVLERELDGNEALQREWQTSRKLKNDPRVTRFGRFLRRWSLDELPQLINVLRGEMSLVGPRPLPDYHRADLHPDTQRLREQVQPGITGLWQVSGRSDAGTAGLDKWDRYYVRNWSVWLDLVILARTIGAVCMRKGAY